MLGMILLKAELINISLYLDIRETLSGVFVNAVPRSLGNEHEPCILVVTKISFARLPTIYRTLKCRRPDIKLELF
jgi:hypothetical protein